MNADSVDDWSRIEQVRLWLLAREVCDLAALEDNEGAFDMADTEYRPVSLRYRRVLFARDVELRNR